MARVDMHVHSRYSDHPSEWFLQRLGSKESYTHPEDIYKAAKKAGMDFVTITDHNCIEGAVMLKRVHPDDVFIGVETTTYFPESGAKVHLLIYDITEFQFNEIERLRESIFDLREYLIRENITHVVAHATFSINRQLTFEHVEMLMVLFDYFEVINGSRTRQSNQTLQAVLESLTPNRIEFLADTYRIAPSSPMSWIKGVTGGSDDHSGLFVGLSSTEATAHTPGEFLAAVRAKNTTAAGRHNDYMGLAIAIYKIVWDFSRSRGNPVSPILSSINSLIFENSPIGLGKRISLERYKRSANADKNIFLQLAINLIKDFGAPEMISIEQKPEKLYARVTEASDALIADLWNKISDSLTERDFLGIISNTSQFLPGLFLMLPFFTTVNALSESRPLLDQLTKNYISKSQRSSKRVVWFTDTITDCNGVAETLRELAKLTNEKGMKCTIATALLPHEDPRTLPPNVLDLTTIASYTPSFFSTYTLRVPSILTAMKKVFELEPDEIYISTPGPVGLVGLLAAKLLHIPCTAVYHTDFTAQAKQITRDETLCQVIEGYINWFFSAATTIAVPTDEYMNILSKRGLPAGKMRRFNRGIDASLFAPVKNARELLSEQWGITDGPILLYVGRISQEKSVDFLRQVYERVVQDVPNCNLVCVGDGPYLGAFKESCSHLPRLFFAGRRERSELPLFYSGADWLVFPSVTNTFGMVILEAQACGLPAIVSDVGGPKEILKQGKTGFVVKAQKLDEWATKLSAVLYMEKNHDKLYAQYREHARRHAVSHYSWDVVLRDIFGDNPVRTAKNDVFPETIMEALGAFD